MRLVEDLRLDSIRLLTLAVEVENRFRVRLDEVDEAGIETVGDLVATRAEEARWLTDPDTPTLDDWLLAAGRTSRGRAPLRRPRRDGDLVRLGGGAGAGARRLRRPAGAWASRRGDRVALIFPTGIEFFDAFFGALLAGAVPVPLYPPVRLGRMDEYLHRTARMLERSGARAGARRLAGAAHPGRGDRRGARPSSAAGRSRELPAATRRASRSPPRPPTSA